MTPPSEVSVVRVPAGGGRVDTSADPLGAAGDVWSPFELLQDRRRSPAVLAAFALLAGLGALVLGAMAVVSATSPTSHDDPVANPPSVGARPAVERKVLALLAKPSTERAVFAGSGGRLVLVVGSGGRAAILIRGLQRATPERPYVVWIVGSGKPTRAGSFTGTEGAALLSARLRVGESVVVATERPRTDRPLLSGFVAARP